VARHGSDVRSAFIETSKITTFETLMQGLPSIAVIKTRLAKTGRKLTLLHYGGMILLAGGLAFGFFKLFLGVGTILSLFITIFMGLGLPHAIITAMIKKRMKDFISLFPDALDLIVRGLRSGLPITESMGSVASEIDEPVGGEFRKVMDQVRIGKNIDEALETTATRIDSPEFKFFMISLSIQRETGGNLAETLSKLSDLLRRRHPRARPRPILSGRFPLSCF
jgi:tight adherence protein B